VDVDPTVTLTVDGSEPASRSGRPHTRSSATAASSNAVPACKDPEALRDVYEKHDTFPEMTEALGAEQTRVSPEGSAAADRPRQFNPAPIA
jgi:hypothetical protein